MNRSSQYRHKIQRIDIPGQNVYDIENEPTWAGLKYYKATGIYNIGKSKNIYTEEYAESDRVRFYIPPNDSYTNEPTVVTMSFVIIGPPDRRNNTILNFTEYIRKGVHRYWDDARNREFDFVVKDEITISDEKWHGSHPYVELQIPMQNLNGRTRIHQ